MSYVHALYRTTYAYTAPLKDSYWSSAPEYFIQATAVGANANALLNELTFVNNAWFLGGQATPPAVCASIALIESCVMPV